MADPCRLLGGDRSNPSATDLDADDAAALMAYAESKGELGPEAARARDALRELLDGQKVKTRGELKFLEL